MQFCFKPTFNLKNNTLVYTLAHFLIQKLIWNKIEYEFLQMEKSDPKLNIYNGIKQTKKTKINRLLFSVGRFFSEILDQLFHQPQLLHYVCIVLINVYIQKQGWHYIHFCKTFYQKFVLS